MTYQSVQISCSSYFDIIESMEVKYISHYIMNNNIDINIISSNMATGFENKQLSTCVDVKIYDNIYLTVNAIETELKTSNAQWASQSTGCQIKRSYILTTGANKQHIEQFINTCRIEYEKYKRSKKLKGARYHFLYKGVDEKQKPIFTTSILEGELIKSFDTFSTIFHPYVEQIKRDIARLNDIAYFEKFGGKRKLGYLFEGPPGTGKTITVSAISKETSRHIMEIPFSRIKKNSELEQLMAIRTIDDIEFNSNEIIILFDEIDRDNAVLNTDNKPLIMSYGFMRDAKDDKDDKDEKDDKDGKDDSKDKTVIRPGTDNIGLGTVLSCTDGVSNYDGVIIVATTNNIDKIPKELYRDQRLTRIHIGFMNTLDCINMITFFGFELSATEKQEVNEIMCLNPKMTPAKLRTIINNSTSNADIIGKLKYEVK